VAKTPGEKKETTQRPATPKAESTPKAKKPGPKARKPAAKASKPAAKASKPAAKTSVPGSGPQAPTSAATPVPLVARAPVIPVVPPPLKPKVSMLTRAQAEKRLEGSVATSMIGELFGASRNFFLVEYQGDLPFGLYIDEQELGDLDEEDGEATNTMGEPIGKFVLLDPPDEETTVSQVIVYY
jgi:hypothetical protein